MHAENSVYFLKKTNKRRATLVRPIHESGHNRIAKTKKSGEQHWCCPCTSLVKIELWRLYAFAGQPLNVTTPTSNKTLSCFAAAAQLCRSSSSLTCSNWTQRPHAPGLALPVQVWVVGDRLQMKKYNIHEFYWVAEWVWEK